MESIDILTIAAHPDDIELTCSGTLMKMLDRGYSLGILDLTQGEMGTRGAQEIRAQEAEAARAVIGARFRGQLKIGDLPLITSALQLPKARTAKRPLRLGWEIHTTELQTHRAIV